ISDRVHIVMGLSVVNCTVIEGETGLIVFDTGNNVGQGKDILKKIREASTKPIKAIIYSHHHYTGGAAAFVEDNENVDCAIYGHPKLQQNRQSTLLALGPMQNRRGGLQVGAYLPEKGEDASIGMVEPRYDDPELNKSGHIAPTHEVAHEEECLIDGLKAKFFHIVSDADDSLVVWFPELDLVLHNSALMGNLFPFYTLRGDFYRTPEAVIEGIDIMRRIKPKYVVGAHAMPILGREAAYETMTRVRDGMAFAYHQAIRAINRGLTPDEMVRKIQVPEHLKKEPRLYEGYVRFEYAFRGFYRGIVGWFAEDTADLNPPPPEILAKEIVDGFGGPENVIKRCKTLLQQKDYELTAKLVTYVLLVDPDNSQARQLKADALRIMARLSPDIQSRHFYLSQALHLEKKIDTSQPPLITFLGDFTTEEVMNTPPGTTLKLLESKIDPLKSIDTEKTLSITFTDLDNSYSLAVRKGVVEFRETLAEKSDFVLNLSRHTWLRLLFGEQSLKNAIESGKVIAVKGSVQEIEDFLNLFDKFR
ncbi:MAG: MBL fold metallo-hydrolase, partial [Proteobacteria bacterium]|nr:MBL fold metallo-hydrolase [Pseudomonadota bacterium]